MRIRLTTLVLAFSWAVTVAVAGCGEEVGATAVLTVDVVTVKAAKVMTGASTDPVKDATAIKFTASGAGMDAVSVEYGFDAGVVGSGALPEFQVGYERQMTVELCSGTCDLEAGGTILSRGRSVLLKILEGDKTKPKTVFVAPLNSFVPPSKVGETDAIETSKIIGSERVGATVTELEDGTLLIIGGAKIKAGAKSWYRPDDIESVSNKAEIYDPQSGVFTSTGILTRARSHHAAIKLGGPNKADGRVVVMGGYESKAGAFVPTMSVEIYDPVTKTFTEEPENRWLAGAGRALMTAGLAYPDDGVIFLAGGISDPVDRGAWLLYQPGRGTAGAGGLTPAEVGPENGKGTPRWNHTMTFLPTYGKSAGGASIPAFVLMGGENDLGTLSEVEAYQLDPWNGGSSSVRRDVNAVTTALPATARTLHSAVYVPGQGIVWVIGGFEDKELTRPINRVEVFRVGALSFTDGEYLDLAEARGGVSATLIETATNTVFIAGGKGAGGPLTRTEMIVETKVCQEGGGACVRQPSIVSDKTPEMDSARVGQAAILDPTSRLLLLGGVSADNAIPDPIFYNPL